MRFLPVLFIALGTLVVSASSSHAITGNAPWCAVMSVGDDSVVWDCQYQTVEACIPNVIAGNRGFCNHNPAWQEQPPRRKRKKRAH